MSWDGYFKLGETEIINATRTDVYARNLRLPWKVQAGGDSAFEGLIGETYSTPDDDSVAPWYDPDNPASARFAGLIPLDISGVENSSRTADVEEYIGDGGRILGSRNGSKTMVFSVALVGQDEAAVEYGFRWLKQALAQRECVSGVGVGCGGVELRYAAVSPEQAGSRPGYGLGGYGEGPYGSPGADTVTWNGLSRYLRDVKVTRGVSLTSKSPGHPCGARWTVQWTMVAGDPFEYGFQRRIFLNAYGTNPGNIYTPPIVGSIGVLNGLVTQPCPEPYYMPLYDPLAPALIAPPLPPDIPVGAIDTTHPTWDRTWALVPAEVIPLWDEVRPIIQVTPSGGVEARNIRLRFYEEADGHDVDCGAVGEYFIGYIPANATLTIDTVAETAYVVDADGYARRADSLVYGANSKPVKWFGLSCGAGFWLTTDRVPGQPNVSTTLDLVPRSE